MEAATPIPFPQVRTRGDRLLIDGLTVSDECTVRLARDREEAGEDAQKLVLDALGIGARVLDREQTAANAEFVRAEFERAAHGLEADFADRARAVTDRLDAKIAEVFGPDSGQVSRLLEKHFDDGSSVAVQNRVKALLAEAGAKMREDLARQFSSDSDSNPLALFQKASLELIKQSSTEQAVTLRAMSDRLEAMKVEITELRAERDGLEQLEAERERGTAKGRTFEQQVCEAVDRLAVAQGDACEAVGDLAEGAQKTGDVLVTIDAARGPGRGRVVFEAKNSQLSRPKALEELDRALAVRSADFAVLVVPSADELPARTHPLREYNGDKLIVTLDSGDGSTLALELAYALARARVLMARGEAAGVDGAAIDDLVERAAADLEDTRKIKQQLTGARTQIDKAGDLVGVMAGKVRAHLAEIARLAAAGSSEA